MGKYDDLVFTIPKEFHKWYGFAAPRGFFRGTTMMQKAKLYMDFTSITKELVMEVPHTHHAVDEYLVLATADFNNFWTLTRKLTSGWATITQRMEMFTITEPTIIRVRRNSITVPSISGVTESQFSSRPIYLDGDWSKINRA
jgi:hypothetical protein